MNVRIEPNSILIAYRKGSRPYASAELEWGDNAVADGRASITASARSEMNEDLQLRAGTRPQFSIPDSSAKCLYSMSISSSVSMCSLTKLGKQTRKITINTLQTQQYRKQGRNVKKFRTLLKHFPLSPSSLKHHNAYFKRHCYHLPQQVK